MADEIRQYPELVAVARQLLARVGDQALALGQPRVVEQHRGHDGEFVRRRAGVHPDLRLEVESARPVLELIVVLEIDLAEPICIRSALLEFSDAREWDRRRPAVGTAGVVDERIRDLGYRVADADIPDAEALGAVLSLQRREGSQPSRDQGNTCRHAYQ